MKAFVDAEACVACGLCPGSCPEVFDMERDAAIVKVKVEVVPPEAEATCREVKENCPVTAISIEE